MKPSHPGPWRCPRPSRGRLPTPSLTAKSLFFCLSLPHQPRPPGLLHSGLPGDWQWGQGRGRTVVGGGGVTSRGQPVVGPGPQHVALVHCRCKMPVQAPAEVHSPVGPTPRGPLWLSLSPWSPPSRPVPASTAPADPRFPPRCLTRTRGLAGSQDRNVVTTQGGPDSS